MLNKKPPQIAQEHIFWGLSSSQTKQKYSIGLGDYYGDFVIFLCEKEGHIFDYGSSYFFKIGDSIHIDKGKENLESFKEMLPWIQENRVTLLEVFEAYQNNLEFLGLIDKLKH